MAITVEEKAIIDKAAQILDREIKGGETLTSPALVRNYLRFRMEALEHEVFAAIFLDTQHRAVEYVELFRGTLDSAAVYPREVAKEALQRNAAAMILAHNHPSGVAEPSDADRRITERLKNALALFDIRVLDHFVVGSSEIISFSERGWL